MQKNFASYVKEPEMTPTATMLEMNSHTSIKTTILLFTEAQRRMRTRIGQKS